MTIPIYRGTFVTHYMYCSQCRRKTIEVLSAFKTRTLSLQYGLNETGRFFFGLIESEGDPDGAVALLQEIAETLEPLLCHRLCIGILPENGPNEVVELVPPPKVALP